MVDQSDDEREEGTQARSPTRTISIRMEMDLLDTARRIGEAVGLGYQTVLKAAARVGLRQFVKAQRIELELPDDVPLPAPPIHDLDEAETSAVLHGPDEVVVHDVPLPRIRP